MFGYTKEFVPFSDLIGKTIHRIEGAKQYNECMYFYCTDGTFYKLFHNRDCCEEVSLEDVVGDIENLLDSRIIKAEELEEDGNDDEESSTWTFYHLTTLKGTVTFRWYGSSNGFYSESVAVFRDSYLCDKSYTKEIFDKYISQYWVE
jgi:hypothetical protein